MNNNIWAIPFFCFMFLASLMVGQVQDTLQNDTITKATKYIKTLPDRMLKFSLWSLVSPLEPSIKVSFQKKIGKKLFFSQDIGLITNYRLYPKTRSKLGYSLAPALRFYRTNAGANDLGYKGVEINFNQSYSKKITSFERENRSYRQLLSYTEKKTRIGLSYIFGREDMIGKTNRMILETSFALGVQYIFVTRDVPDDARPISNFFFDPGSRVNHWNNRKYVMPRISFNFNIGYVRSK